MTHQAPDKVIYKGQEFILAGLKGNGLFRPIDFGITSEMIGCMTACYRGYCCKYKIIDEKLFLVELSVITGASDQIPLIEGVAAKTGPFYDYQNLKILCPLSGGLVMVRNLLGLNLDFPSPLEFEIVVEVLFEQGMLQREIDHSIEMAGLRQTVDEFKRSLLESTDGLSEALRKWDSHPEKRSDQEKKMCMENIDKVIEKRFEIHWSFVSDYEQQPTMFKGGITLI
jgi:hypothetical protein